jgi:hypothetical protein
MRSVPRPAVAVVLAGAALFAPSAAYALLPTPPAPPPRPKLYWAPPQLTNPITLTVPAAGGSVSLDPTRDYVLRVGHVEHKGGLVISGGHNVVLIGGEITIPYAGAYAQKGGGDRRGLGIFGSTGTVHIEGLLIDGPDVSEGIQIVAPKATVQLENVRIVGIHARDEKTFTDNHPDLVQPYGGVRSLRIDRLTGSSDYQGLFLVSDLGPVRSVALRNVDITGSPTARFLLWVDGPQVTYNNVWIRPAPGRSLAYTIWPVGSQPIRLVGTGTPPTGEFVPAGAAGQGYLSPGYGG